MDIHGGLFAPVHVVRLLRRYRGAQCELLDLVGAEPRPVVVTSDNDRRLHVTEGLETLERFGILADVDAVVGNALLVEGTVGGVALHARRFGVDSDSHVTHFLPDISDDETGQKFALVKQVADPLSATVISPP